jgi:hypothetical protein
VPKGVSVALVDSGAEGAYPFLIAVGQLPDQRVLPALALASGGPGPDWVACWGRGIRDDRYVPVDFFEGGLLLRRRP